MNPDHYPGRTAEYMSAAFLICWAIALLWPGSVTDPVYERLVRSTGLGEVAIGASLLAAGTLWVTMLIINGHWRRSPAIRAILALAAAVFFSQMGFAFWRDWSPGLQPPVGMMMGAVLTFFNALACGRASSEAVKAHMQGRRADATTSNP